MSEQDEGIFGLENNTPRATLPLLFFQIFVSKLGISHGLQLDGSHCALDLISSLYMSDYYSYNREKIINVTLDIIRIKSKAKEYEE